MLCIYHNADHDGKGSAAIVKYAHQNEQVTLQGFNYDNEIPYDEIEKHDKIVIVDVSFDMKYMFELAQTKKLIWIDHHALAIEKYEEEKKNHNGLEIEGVRQSGVAAIELSWRYFLPEREVPLGVKLLALNDLFDLRDKRVRPFEYGFLSLGVNRPYERVWRDLFEDKIDIDEMVLKGEAILSYIRQRDYRFSRNLSFTGKYKGLKFIAANMPQAGVEFFESLDNIKDFDFMVSFSMNKRSQWNLSFRTTREDVDVASIASEFGGGGHKKASGASALSELPAFLREGVEMWTK